MLTTHQRASMTKARYDGVAQYYERVMRPLERWFLNGLRSQTLSQLPAAGRLLEVGAGTGLNFIFYPADAHGVASELSREMLKIAREKPKPCAIKLIQNDAEDLPFQTASFDAAFATLVFCSVKSPNRALAELRRVVRPGGTIVLLEHVRPEGMLGLLFDLLNLLTVRLFDDHVNRRTAAEASKAGLEVLRVEKRALGIINLITCRA